MNDAKKNQAFRAVLLIVGIIFALGMAYGGGMKRQVKKLQAQNDKLVTTRRDLRLAQMDLRNNQALTQQLEARRQLSLALIELDKRNFGAAQEHLGEVSSRLETIKKANDAAQATKPQQPMVSLTNLTAIGEEVKQVNLTATPDTGSQRERLQALAAQMDAELSKAVPAPDAEFAPITVDPPTLNDVPQLPGNDVTKN
jgi:DNA repair exonuclease SbcCD ATPase subunit